MLKCNGGQRKNPATILPLFIRFRCVDVVSPSFEIIISSFELNGVFDILKQPIYLCVNTQLITMFFLPYHTSHFSLPEGEISCNNPYDCCSWGNP